MQKGYVSRQKKDPALTGPKGNNNQLALGNRRPPKPNHVNEAWLCAKLHDYYSTSNIGLSNCNCSSSIGFISSNIIS